MKSYWIVTRGDCAALERREIPVPQPEHGELLVRVRASALNRGELIVGGVMHGGPEKLGGNEVAGEIEALGAGVTGLEAGERVMGRARGAFADYVLMDAHQAIRIPPRLSWEEAAAVPVSYLTAYEMLVSYGRLRSGEWLLVTGASAGAGVASIQIAKTLGARTIGTSGSAEKLERLAQLGLDVAIRTRQPDFAAKAREATGGTGIDLAVNLVGGSMFAECLRSLAKHGRLAVVGYVDGIHHADIDLEAVHANRLQIFGVSNARLDAEGRAAAVRGFTRDILPAIEDGRITPVVDRVFRFEELPEAKAAMESNAMVGKLVVRVS
jgi:NADPH:quinone reductase-like Zn-dependent oxidoreductase